MEFLISTKAPALLSLAKTLPLRKYVNGPTLASLPIFDSVQFDSTTLAPSSTMQSSRVVRGPITAPVLITLFPYIAHPG